MQHNLQVLLLQCRIGATTEYLDVYGMTLGGLCDWNVTDTFTLGGLCDWNATEILHTVGPLQTLSETPTK